MNKIEKLIQDYCPEGVLYRELKEVAYIGTGSTNGNEATENGKYPLFVRSKTVKMIDTYEFDEEAIIIPGEGGIGEIFHYVNGKYALHQRAYRISLFTEKILTKFIYYYMMANFKKFILQKAVNATVSSIRKPMIEKFTIPLLPLPVQQEIVNILDKFTQLEQELNAELETRRKQYDFYLNHLMGFEGSEVEWKTLGEIAEFKYGFTDKAKDKGNVRFVRITDINEYGKLRDNDYKYIDLTAENEEYILSKGDLLMARTGATFGKTMLFNENYPAVYASFLIRIRFIGEIILPDYYWHFSQSSLYWNQAYELVGGGAQPQFNANALKAVKIPIPPLSEQESIVSILDKFDSLVNDSKISIQAEIEARRKQYAYYRNKLLTFGEYA